MSNPGRFGGSHKCVRAFAPVVLLVVAVLLVANTVHAQTSVTVNPRIVSFVASPDQNAVDSSGRPMVAEYDLQFLPAGGTTPVQVLNLGKPTPAADGTITVDFSALLSSPPAPGQQLDAVVAAVGPSGSGLSSPSNAFMFDCTATVTPTTVSTGAQPANGSISVSAYTGCGWQATSGASWISITSGGSGSGNGSVTYSTTANPTTSTRTATMTVAGKTVTLTQAAGTASNTPPTVSVTSPTNGSAFTAPASITLTASAGDTDGTVSRVDFYANNTLIKSVAAAPYTFAWTNVAAGNYTITAVATDNASAQTTSAAVSITVKANVPPTVQVTSPVSGSSFTAPASIAVTASASDTDGISSVVFFAGSTQIGTATAAPYAITWANVPAGSYTLTAVATDKLGAKNTSAGVPISVVAAPTPSQPANVAPTVQITSPGAGASIVSQSAITITAAASDSDGTVSRVDFLVNGTVVGSATSSPYSVKWNPPTSGTYTLTAVAADNAGATTTSSPVSVNVQKKNKK